MIVTYLFAGAQWWGVIGMVYVGIGWLVNAYTRSMSKGEYDDGNR